MNDFDSESELGNEWRRSELPLNPISANAPIDRYNAPLRSGCAAPTCAAPLHSAALPFNVQTSEILKLLKLPLHFALWLSLASVPSARLSLGAPFSLNRGENQRSTGAGLEKRGEKGSPSFVSRVV